MEKIKTTEFRDRCNWKSREKAGRELLLGIATLFGGIAMLWWWASCQ
jgi:hypothetical protein